MELTTGDFDLRFVLAAIFALQLALAAPAAARATPTIQRNIPYRSVAGRTLTLDAYLPSARNRRHAAIVFVHGGGWRAGDKSVFAPGEAAFAPTGLRLARLGFAVFAINYRLAPAARFPAALSDVTAAVRWVRKRARHFDIDPGRLALFGVSAGGNLAALVATEGRGSLTRYARVRVAVSWSGPMDLSRFDAQLGGPAHHPSVESYLGCPPPTALTFTPQPLPSARSTRATHRCDRKQQPRNRSASPSDRNDASVCKRERRPPTARRPRQPPRSRLRSERLEPDHQVSAPLPPLITDTAISGTRFAHPLRARTGQGHRRVNVLGIASFLNVLHVSANSRALVRRLQ